MRPIVVGHPQRVRSDEGLALEIKYWQFGDSPNNLKMSATNSGMTSEDYPPRYQRCFGERPVGRLRPSAQSHGYRLL